MAVILTDVVIKFWNKMIKKTWQLLTFRDVKHLILRKQRREKAQAAFDKIDKDKKIGEYSLSKEQIARVRIF